MFSLRCHNFCTMFPREFGIALDLLTLSLSVEQVTARLLFEEFVSSGVAMTTGILPGGFT